MSLWDSVKKFAQPYADEDDYDDYDEEEEELEEEEAVQESAPRRNRYNPFATNASPRTPREPEHESAAAAPQQKPAFSGQVLNTSAGNKQEVVLFHAKTFEDAAKATLELRKRRAIILNMENVDKALTRRVVDFLSGSVYALDGNVKKVAQSTYLFCPHNMDVLGDLENAQAEIESLI